MKKIALFGLSLTLVLFAVDVSVTTAQCVPRSNTYYGELLPNVGCANFNTVTDFTLGSYFRTPLLEGGRYIVSTCGSTVDTQITGFQGTNTTTDIFYNDDNGPICSGVQASVTYDSTFTDYTRVNVNQYNCLPGPGPTATVAVRQENNLEITSSSASMCVGQSRSLTATPNRVTGTPLIGSGDPGTFSGTGVSGTTFTAPTPGGSSQSYFINYAFGYCSTGQNLTVFQNPSTANAGSNQIVCSTSATLQGNTPTFGLGSWTTLSGPGAASSPSSPTTGVTGLAYGSPTTLQWTITNGTCTPSNDQVILTVDPVAPVADTPSLADVEGCFSVPTPTPTATDNCIGSVSGTPDVSFPVTTPGTTVVTWTYTDSFTNTSTQTQNVTVKTVEVGVTQNQKTLTATASPATYQWLDCDNGNTPVAGATNQSFTPKKKGNYAVQVTEDGCTDTSACTYVKVFSWPMFLPGVIN